MIVLNQIVDAFIPAISEEELDNGGFSLIDQSFKSRFLPKFGEENTDMSSSVMNITTTQHSRALLLSGAKELGVAKVMAEAMQKLLLKEEQAQVQLLLQLMSSSWGNFLINGYSLGFQNMTLEDRVAALRALRDSYIPQLRSAYQVFKRLTGSLFTAYPFTQSLNKYGLKSNPNWYAMGYEPGVTMNKQATSTKTKQITQVPKPIESIDEIKEGGERRKGDGSNSSNSGNSSSNRRVYDADVVVVGSGAGGGTIAAQLVKAGHKVLVLEKGSYYSAEQFKNWTEAEAFEQAFERGGLCATKDGNIIILAGATVGGGTQVNWSASFRTPDYVRRRWANTHTGMLAFKDGGEFEAALDEAHELFNVNTDFVNKPSAATTDVEDLVKVKAGGQLKEIGKGCPSYLHSAAEGICNDGPSIGYHLSLDTNDTTTLNEITALGGGSEGEDKSGGICINLNNEILCKGAAAEGLHAEVIPRNTLGCVDCGHCCHGCPYGAKQSTVTSQLEPLASTGSLHLLPNCYVDKVLIENKKACGVEGYITTGSNEVDGEVGGKISIKVNAKIVVSSGGSLHTPCLLLRSGLKNAHIGRHIALHPVVAVGIHNVHIYTYYILEYVPMCIVEQNNDVNIQIIYRWFFWPRSVTRFVRTW